MPTPPNRRAQPTRPGRTRGAVPLSVAAAAAVAAAAVLMPVSAGRTEAPPPSVILLVVDTLRADHLGCYGDPDVRTPAIDRLARRSAQFRCMSTAPWTLPATASVMSGRRPSAHGADFPRRPIPEDQPLLAEELLAEGYATAGFVSHTMVGSQFGFHRGFQIYYESNALGHQHVSSDSVTALARAWLTAERAPFFLFLHYFDPHYDYVAHRNWTAESRYHGRVRSGMDIWELRRMIPSLRASDIAQLHRLYRGEIRFLDGSIRTLMHDVERRGLLETATIIMTADHGEEFLEHGWLGHTRNLRDVLLDVPMLVRAPGRIAPGLRAERASLIDVRPTVRAACGLPARAEDGGTDLAGSVGERPLIAEVTYDDAAFPQRRRRHKVRDVMGLGKTADAVTVREGDWKLVHDRTSGRWSLYDLEADPGERDDVAARHPARVRKMRVHLEAVSAAARSSSGDADDVPMTEEQIEALRALGYVE